MWNLSVTYVLHLLVYSFLTAAANGISLSRMQGVMEFEVGPRHGLGVERVHVTEDAQLRNDGPKGMPRLTRPSFVACLRFFLPAFLFSHIPPCLGIPSGLSRSPAPTFVCTFPRSKHTQKQVYLHNVVIVLLAVASGCHARFAICLCYPARRP